MTIEIVITKRSGDYYAQIKDHPELWAAGKSYRQVVGDLVMTHKEQFGVKIVFPE
jgi:hypothetical protein